MRKESNNGVCHSLAPKTSTYLGGHCSRGALFARLPLVLVLSEPAGSASGLIEGGEEECELRWGKAIKDEMNRVP